VLPTGATNFGRKQPVRFMVPLRGPRTIGCCGERTGSFQEVGGISCYSLKGS
jgi:hypothetical protein